MTDTYHQLTAQNREGLPDSPEATLKWARKTRVRLQKKLHRLPIREYSALEGVYSFTNQEGNTHFCAVLKEGESYGDFKGFDKVLPFKAVHTTLDPGNALAHRRNMVWTKNKDWLKDDQYINTRLFSIRNPNKAPEATMAEQFGRDIDAMVMADLMEHVAPSWKAIL